MSEPLREDRSAHPTTSPPSAEPAGSTDARSGESAPPPPTAAESLVNALLASGPEVAEHVVNAARELLLAAQAIVDAADHAVREQQELRDGAAGAEPDAGSPGAPVRSLDLAE